MLMGLYFENSEQFIKDYRQLLENNGISNAHVARKMDISPQQLQNVYKKKELTVLDITRLCNAIGYNVGINIDKKGL